MLLFGPANWTASVSIVEIMPISISEVPKALEAVFSLWTKVGVPIKPVCDSLGTVLFFFEGLF